MNLPAQACSIKDPLVVTLGEFQASKTKLLSWDLLQIVAYEDILTLSSARTMILDSLQTVPGYHLDIN